MQQILPGSIKDFGTNTVIKVLSHDSMKQIVDFFDDRRGFKSLSCATPHQINDQTIGPARFTGRQSLLGFAQRFVLLEAQNITAH